MSVLYKNVFGKNSNVNSSFDYPRTVQIHFLPVQEMLSERFDSTKLSKTKNMNNTNLCIFGKILRIS